MSILSRLMFRQKLFLLLVPALLGLIYFAGDSIFADMDQRRSAAAIEPLVELTAKNSQLVHELQKERGATAGFIGSGGKKFGDILSQQRKDTSRVAKLREEFLSVAAKEIDNDKVRNILRDIANELGRLEQIRSRVDRQDIAGKEAIGYYTGLNARLLAISADVAGLASDGLLANQLQAFYNFLQGKERAGIERAVLSNTFGGDRFGSGMYRRFVQLVTEQDAYMDTFFKVALPGQQQFYSETMRHDSIGQVERMRKVASERAADGGFGIEATDWFRQATNRINQLKKIEDRLTNDLLALSAEQFAAAERAILLKSVVTLVVVLLVSLLGILIGRLLSNQMKALVAAIDEAGSTRNLAIRAEVITADELGRSARHFNDMISVFENTVQDIEVSSVQLAAVAEETATTVEDNLKSLDRQRSETALVATATEQMTATVQEVAGNTSITSDAADHVDQLTDESVRIVADTMTEMDKLTGEMEQANQSIGQLQESSGQISSIVDVIKSVAEQTNLLALNAAIEAARAGDQGRGFAVVADEVRTLAQRTQESTAEIENMVGRFQEDAGVVSGAIENCVSTVGQTVEQTRSIEQKLAEIDSSVDSIKGMCQQVATAAEEQVAVTNEIADNVRSISELADVGAAGGSQIASAAREQAQLAVALQELSGSFKCS